MITNHFKRLLFKGLKHDLRLRQLGAALFAVTMIVMLSPIIVHAVPIYAITQSGKLVLFDSQTSYEFTNSMTIAGLQPNESVLAIDFRPATRQLYALGSTSRLYVINTFTGAATPVGAGPFAPVLNGKFFGFDFDPVADRARVVSDTHQNLLLHPETGAVTAVYEPTAYVSGDLHAGGIPLVTGLAYSNNVAGASATTLYGFDFRQAGVLVKFDPLNSGKLKTVGPIREINAVDAIGDHLAAFDISDSGTAYLALSFFDMDVGPMKYFCTIDLATARATNLGFIGSGESVRGIAINPTGLPTPAPTALPPGTPVLLRELNSPRAIALDSVSMLRDPLPVKSKYNFSSDKRTRLMLFASNIELMAGENSSVITAQAEDSNGIVYPLTVEFVGKVPNFDWLTQINVKLPDGLSTDGIFGPDYIWVTISLRGVEGNKALVILDPDVV
ncbi:MAG: DUF4394 domain-containing protein [Acidobacteriota bacterium]